MFGIIMCPNLKRYPEAPKDQSISRITNCPYCGDKVWLSKKKEALMQNLHRYELYCYDCIEAKAKKNPEFVTEALRIDI